MYGPLGINNEITVASRTTYSVALTLDFGVSMNLVIEAVSGIV
jgi:hypothetical protein